MPHPLRAQLAPAAAVLDAEGHAHVSFFGAPCVTDLLSSVAAGTPVALAVWSSRGLPGAPGASPPPLELLDDPAVRTRSVQLRFESPDEAFAAMVPAARRNVAVRERFDRLLAAANNRSPAVDLGARYLLVTGRRK